MHKISQIILKSHPQNSGRRSGLLAVEVEAVL